MEQISWDTVCKIKQVLDNTHMVGDYEIQQNVMLILYECVCDQIMSI